MVSRTVWGGSGLKQSDKWRLGPWGELVIRRWFTSQGYWVVPQSLIDNGGAPAFERWAKEHLILSDLLVGRKGVRTSWIEVKTKTKSVPNNLRRRDELGVDERHWKQYVEAQSLTSIIGRLAIVEKEGQRLFVGDLAEIEKASVVWVENLPEPRRFFDLRRFERFSYNKGWLTSMGIYTDAPNITPVVSPRPWEQRLRKPNRQIPLL